MILQVGSIYAPDSDIYFIKQTYITSGTNYPPTAAHMSWFGMVPLCPAGPQDSEAGW